MVVLWKCNLATVCFLLRMVKLSVFTLIKHILILGSSSPSPSPSPLFLHLLIRLLLALPSPPSPSPLLLFRYGGSVENRCRLLFAAVKTLVGVMGEGRVGVRLSPTTIDPRTGRQNQLYVKYVLLCECEIRFYYVNVKYVLVCEL